MMNGDRHHRAFWIAVVLISICIGVVLVVQFRQRGRLSGLGNGRQNVNRNTSADVEFAEVGQDDDSRETQLAMSLHSLLKRHGSLARALSEKGLEPELDAQGEVIAITDAMMRGNLSDSEFELLTQLKNLRRLILRGTQLTDKGLAALSGMPQLEGLLIENEDTHRMSDAALENLRYLPRLKEFSLDDSDASGSGLKHVLHPTLIENLSFDRTPISQAGIEAISGFCNLRHLLLWRGVEITDEVLHQLTKCSRLESLDLALGDGGKVTGSGIRCLARFPELKTLSLGDIQVSDEAISDILKIAKLKEVSFGENVVSVNSVERLRAAGIEVDHGVLLGLKRDSNVLRYAGVDFAIDRGRSSLCAFMRLEDEGVSWQLKIECLDEYVPDHMQPASLTGPGFDFDRPWRQLPGQKFRIAFDESKLHPILPDNPCNIYVGWHACPNHHIISFVERRGNCFLIDWKSVAKESLQDEGRKVWVNGEIPFESVTVWSENLFDLGLAKEVVKRRFDVADLGEPEVSGNGRQSSYCFPIIVQE